MESKGDQPSPQVGERVAFSREEWQTFWKREYTILYTIAIKMLSNEADAQDAVQEALRSLLGEGREELELRGKSFEETVRAFLIQVVKFKAIDILRIRKREKELQERLALEPQATNSWETMNPEQQVLHQHEYEETQQDEVIQGIAGKLSPSLRKIFLFIVQHLNDDKEDLWLLLAAEQGYDPNSKLDRNSHFDVPMKRMREKFHVMGVYTALKAKGAYHAN
jgi:DNA-directed RNA polymerase specialized sigma24 family protein